MTSYAWAHIAHLLCALVFVGGVLFEALILSALHRPEVGRETRREAERAIAARAVRVMPWVVGLLFASGLLLAHRYAEVLTTWPLASMAWQLWLKILLAFSILAHFVGAVYRMRRGTMTGGLSRYIHRAVLVQMLVIVVLAKAMFYWVW